MKIVIGLGWKRRRRRRYRNNPVLTEQATAAVTTSCTTLTFMYITKTNKTKSIQNITFSYNNMVLDLATKQDLSEDTEASPPNRHHSTTSAHLRTKQHTPNEFIRQFIRSIYLLKYTYSNILSVYASGSQPFCLVHLYFYKVIN